MSEEGTDWTDLVVGDRMAVDREFADRVAASTFSRQEWGLVMTATELRIEDADDPDSARIVADSSRVSAVLPEFENLREAQAIGAGGGMGQPSTGGLVASVKDLLGLGGSGSGASDDERLEAATRLTQEYARTLQKRLQERGRWEEILTAAGESDA